MAYFKDLSGYTYCKPQVSDGNTKNVGWLEANHEFPKAPPKAEMLDILWEYCKISVNQTRGLHVCEFCQSGDSYRAERKGERLTLGSSEIRVFGQVGIIYAAPTLIFHYIAVHHYEPPEEFIHALSGGPRPPNAEYFQSLERIRLEWNKTPVPPLNAQRVNFVDSTVARKEQAK
jgi:hypothetical protein